MAGKSSVDKLPPPARKVAERAARDPASTIHGTVEAVREAGGEVSKSAMGRWLKEAREQLAEYRSAQEVAGLWVKQLGENPEGDTGVMLSETLKLLALSVVRDLKRRALASDEGVQGVKPVTAMELMLASKALDHVATGDGKNQKRRITEQQLARAEAAAVMREVSQAAGISEETIREAEQRLGIKRATP